jgi:hypothetical protein
MNPVRHIRRLAAVLAGLAAALVIVGTTPAFARVIPGTEFRPSAQVPVPVRTVTHIVVLGGMPGWQIALIAVGAALVTAALVVLADRARTAHRKTAAAAA